MTTIKKIVPVLLLSIGFSTNANTLACSYVSSVSSHLENGFLDGVNAQFNCNGKLTQFVGENMFVSCKPQFVLSDFVNHLVRGEMVKFIVEDSKVSNIDGSSSMMTMVKSAVSASGILLKPQTIIQHGKPVVCDPTQIVVN